MSRCRTTGGGPGGLSGIPVGHDTSPEGPDGLDYDAYLTLDPQEDPVKSTVGEAIRGPGSEVCRSSVQCERVGEVFRW
jgi:hypothetical protein